LSPRTTQIGKCRASSHSFTTVTRAPIDHVDINDGRAVRSGWSADTQTAGSIRTRGARHEFLAALKTI
jgi:hypothetical protein